MFVSLISPTGDWTPRGTCPLHASDTSRSVMSSGQGVMKVIVLLAVILPVLSGHLAGRTIQTKQACQYSILLLSCPPGETLDISFANYGHIGTKNCGSHMPPGGCRAPDSLAIVQGMCQGRQQCYVPASDATFNGNPCHHGYIMKYLEVKYECQGPEVEQLRACKRETLSIQCPTGHPINIVSALYGRTSSQFCPGQIYTTACRSPYSLDVVRSICQGKTSCSVWSDDSVFVYDPCYGTDKYLEVEFICSGKYFGCT
ncbi:EVA1C [Branchiostoma lanceolatum]|uniref:EVA1C protein n=1 Tax=Branchiostoma lanceolatum TaxID=7740 RepID=A0A8K0A4C0_BRALA|nr:EVA1C [Branchiostoma lanceolatum]